MDFIVCNGIGIELGVRVCHYFEVQEYQYVGFFEERTLYGKLTRAMKQFSPSSWTEVKWEPTKDLRRFFAVQLLIVALLIGDLNAFYLKHVLWVPFTDNLNIYRLGLIWLMGVPSLRQLYIYMTDSKVKRLGTQAWVMAAVLSVEVLIVLKFGRGMFPDPVPTHVIQLWLVLIPVYIFLVLSLIHI